MTLHLIRPLTFLVLLSFFFAARGLHGEDKAVYASDFSNGLDGWTGREGFGNSKPKLSIETDDAKEEGKPYCTVITDGKLGCGMVLKPIVSVEEGKEYLLSFWFKNDKASPVTYHLINANKGNGESTGSWRGIRKSEGEWVRVEYSFIPSSDKIGLEIGVSVKDYEPARLCIYDVKISTN